MEEERRFEIEGEEENLGHFAGVEEPRMSAIFLFDELLRLEEEG